MKLLAKAKQHARNCAERETARPRRDGTHTKARRKAARPSGEQRTHRGAREESCCSQKRDRTRRMRGTRGGSLTPSHGSKRTNARRKAAHPRTEKGKSDAGRGNHEVAQRPALLTHGEPAHARRRGKRAARRGEMAQNESARTRRCGNEAARRSETARTVRRCGTGH